MKRERIEKPRSRVTMNTRTEIIQPANTRRQRTRGDSIRAALQSIQNDLEDALDVFEED